MTLNSTDLYAEQWSKGEHLDLKYLSEWKDHETKVCFKSFVT